MLKKLLDVNIYSAIHILIYGDLLELDKFTSVSLLEYGDEAIYSLNYESINKYDIFKIRKLVKFEPNFLNCIYSGTKIKLNFRVPTSSVNIIHINSITPLSMICGNKMCMLNTLLNKKAPVTKLVAEAFLFLF